MQLTSLAFLRKAFLGIAMVSALLMGALTLFGSYQITHATSPDQLEMVATLQKTLQVINVITFCCFMMPSLVLQILHGKSLFFLYSLLFFIFFNNLNLVWLSGKYTARITGKFVMADYILFLYYMVAFTAVTVLFFIGSFLIYFVRKKRAQA